ncbi:hypothetical protein R3P38DRAFT_3221860 [Favolaschia claudopus]|uniref:Uncharacterized protein n=1 Tax=Favolaschia claudopus TaxID=2862362 RepID=A0AAV9ZZX3_9AGAR
MLSPSMKTDDLQRGEHYIPMDFGEMMQVFSGESKITAAVITYDYPCLWGLGITDGEPVERAWAEQTPCAEVRMMPAGQRRCLVCGKLDLNSLWRSFDANCLLRRDARATRKFDESVAADDETLPELEETSNGDEVLGIEVRGNWKVSSSPCLCTLKSKL